ncbi:MAG: hypothetical protein AAB688_01510 [Patescibacteria group bacterium]
MANKNLQPIGPPLQPTTYKLQPKKGFAMLFSVLISSLLVAIGLSIFSLTLKELTISTSARESQVAFYAANSGMDCAIYWNFQDKFAGSVAPDVSGVQCGESFGSASASGDVYKFKFDITSDTNGPCVEVVVTKGTDTIIESRGKNICGAEGRKVERGLTATIITPPATLP